jgi:hypothetical protein
MTPIFYIRAKSLIEVTSTTVLKMVIFLFFTSSYIYGLLRRSSEASEPNIQHIQNPIDDHQRNSSRPRNMTTDKECSGFIFLPFPAKNCQILFEFVIGRLIPHSLQLRASVALTSWGSCPMWIELAKMCACNQVRFWRVAEVQAFVCFRHSCNHVTEAGET